jgi:hypothetical protein
MKTIKSFNDFDKPAQHVDEQLFKRAKEKRAEKQALQQADSSLNTDKQSGKIWGVKGKEVWKDESGKKHKIVWKSQDSTNFIVKLINDMDVLDASGNLTPNGQTSLTSFLNEENSFVNQYGKLDQNFFNTKIIAYTVKRDNDRKQKIQFTILDKAALEAKIEAIAQDGQEMLSLDGVNFINASLLVNIDKPVPQNQNILIDQTEIIVTPVETEETKETEETEIDEIPLDDDSLIGKKFEYQSGADGKLYIITIDKGENGELKFWAKSQDGTSEGWVVLKGEEPFWIGKDGKESAIANAKDRAFFKRIYVDRPYLLELIAAFEAKYPEGYDFTIKDILYYMNGNKIYGEESRPNEPTSYELTV